MTRVPTSLQGVLVAPRSIGFRTQQLTRLPPDWARIRFLYCGLCGSDLSMFEGRRVISYPASLGHEFVGEVVRTGSDVRALTKGDMVTSDLNYRCGSCDQCRARRSHLCREGRLGLFTNRAFASAGDFHVSYLLRLDGPVDKHHALSEPLSCVLHASRWARLSRGDRILIIGAGGLGACMAFALSNGATPFAFEVTDRMPNRLSMLNAASAPTGRAVTRPEGEYDVVFDLSGSAAGLRSACEYVKAGGRLCSMSHLDGYPNGAFLLGSLTRRDVTFKVSYLNGERENLEAAARLLTHHWNQSWDSVIEVVPLAQLQRAFEQRRASGWCKTLVDVSKGRPRD